MSETFEKREQDEKDLDKKVDEPKEKQDDKIDKKSLEFLSKTWEQVLENARKISPESTKDLYQETDIFKTECKNIDEDYKWKKITKEERDRNMEQLVKQYIEKMISIVWTMEWKQSKQNEAYWKQLETQQKNYWEQLEDFLKQLKKIAEEQIKNKKLKDGLDNWKEARKKWNEEAEKSKAEAIKGLTESLWEWSKK